MVRGIGQDSRRSERHLVVAIDLDDGAVVGAGRSPRMPEARRHRPARAARVRRRELAQLLKAGARYVLNDLPLG